MSSELKTCPFCGGEPAVHGNSKAYWVICMKCSAYVSYPRFNDNDAKAKAIERWNRRVEKDGGQENEQ